MSVLVHVGQCGNQLGDAFWRLTAGAKETPAGSSSSSSRGGNGVAPQKKSSATAAAARAARSAGTPLPLLYADNFFHRGSRRARCILVDTEPKVIHSVLHGSGSPKDGRFEPAHVHFEQSGRGNNWAMGYNLQTHQRNVLRAKSGAAVSTISSAVAVARTTKKKLLLAEAAAQASEKRELVELVMESLRHEVEALDAYRGTVLMHSLGGGTGAGLGCRLLETIRDVYPRSYLGAVSVAPSCASGDTPLQNYNALFTLQHLQEHTDFVVYKENDELMRAASYWKALGAAQVKGAPSPREADGVAKVTLREMNALVAADVAGAMFPIVRKGVDRGLVAQPFDMAKLVHDLCPLPTTKFLDTRTGVLREGCVNSNKIGSAGVDPLFHGVPRSISGGEEGDTAVAKLMRYTTQSFPRWTSASRAIGATAVVRQSPSMLFEEAGLSGDALARSLTASLPRLHLGNRLDISQSAFAPFQSHGGKASTTITLNNGHAVTSIEHFLDRGRRQLQARAYIHWYKQYGLEDDDFENSFEQCTKIVRNYDELLHP